MSVKGLERVIQNLNSLSRLIVPEATAKALNRVASRTISQEQSCSERGKGG